MCVKDGTCNQVQTPVHEERGAQEHGDQPKHQGNIRHCPFSWSGLWKFKRPSEERPWRSSHRGHNCECIHLPSVWTGLQHHGIIFGAQQKRTQQQDCTIGNVQLQCWQDPKLRLNTQRKKNRNLPPARNPTLKENTQKWTFVNNAASHSNLLLHCKSKTSAHNATIQAYNGTGVLFWNTCNVDSWHAEIHLLWCCSCTAIKYSKLTLKISWSWPWPKQACKLGRCDSYLQNQKLPITHRGEQIIWYSNIIWIVETE